MIDQRIRRSIGHLIDAGRRATCRENDRLASVNEVGTSIVSAVDYVRGSNLGPLGVELDRVWADLQTAPARFERRVRTRTTARVVTLHRGGEREREPRDGPPDGGPPGRG